MRIGCQYRGNDDPIDPDLAGVRELQPIMATGSDKGDVSRIGASLHEGLRVQVQTASALSVRDRLTIEDEADGPGRAERDGLADQDLGISVIDMAPGAKTDLTDARLQRCT